MELFLQQNGQQVGPFSEEQVAAAIAANQITRDDLIWHTGLTEWQPIHTVISLPVTSNSVPAPNTQPQAQSLPPVPQHRPQELYMVTTNVKQGALIGGSVCFGLGLICMMISLFTFFLYGPFFLVAAILSIVAMSQKRVMGGILLLVATLIIPTILGSILFVTRTVDLAEDFSNSLAESNVANATSDTSGSDDSSNSDATVNTDDTIAKALKKGIEKAKSDSDLKMLEDLRKRKAKFDSKLVMLKSFKLLQADFSKTKDSIGMAKPVIELTIKNDTGHAVKRAYFRGILFSPDRSIPWVDDTFNYEIAGGVEHGEKVTWTLAPNMFSEWGKVKAPDDAEFKVTVLRLNGPDDEELFGEVRFSESEGKKLIELEKKYSSE